MPTLAERNLQIFGEDEIISHNIVIGGLSKEIRTIEKYRYIKNIPYNVNVVIHNGTADWYSFYDVYKGYTRFNIRLHGGVSEAAFGDTGGRVYMEHRWVGADEVATVVRNAREKMHFDCIRMLSCNSADGGHYSLISKLSSELRMPVKGYHGAIQTTDADFADQLVKYHGFETGMNLFKNFDRLGRSSAFNETSPSRQIFSRMGRTMMAGTEFFPV